MHPADQAIIQAFLAGHEGAVESIRTWLEESVWRFRPQLRLPWEDVRQELLLEAFQTLQSGEFRGEARLRTFLWRLAKFRCLNLLRDQRRPGPQPAPEAVLEAAPAFEASPLDRIAERQSTGHLQALMARMPPECRDLWARILEGWSYRRISEDLGVSEGALRVRALKAGGLSMRIYS